ncbi:MAG: DUF2079 domain-containing protein [Acidimicrobiales bacterium]
MSLPWRKRLDHRLLRWQARFESTGFNRTAPWVWAAVLWIVLLALALARSRELSQNAQLATPMQTVWLIGEGFRPESSLLGYNYLFDQLGLLIYPVAGLTSLFPTAITLLVIQSGALALGVVPLWRLARHVADLRIGATMAIVLAYSLYSAVHAINLAGFHLEVLAVPALIGAVHNGIRQRWTRYWPMIAVVLLARADLGIVVAGMGVLWLLEGRRRAGVATVSVGLLYAGLAILVIQPAIGDGNFPHVDAYAAYGGDDPFRVAWGIVTSPVLFLRELFSEANFRTGVALLAPVLFLPVAAPRWLLPTMPLFTMYLVADVEEGTLAEASQWVPITAFVFVATVFGLARTGRVMVKKVNVDRRLLSALVFTALVFFVRDSVSSPYEEPWTWGRRDAVDESRLSAAELIPDDAVVRAGSRLLPLLTERTGLFELRFDAGEDPAQQADAVAQGVNWVIADFADAPSTWTARQFDIFAVQFPVALGWVQVLDDRETGIRVFTLPSEAERLGLTPVVGAGDDTDRAAG